MQYDRVLIDGRPLPGALPFVCVWCGSFGAEGSTCDLCLRREEYLEAMRVELERIVRLQLPDDVSVHVERPEHRPPSEIERTVRDMFERAFLDPFDLADTIDSAPGLEVWAHRDPGR